jgi:hypothetical protein
MSKLSSAETAAQPRVSESGDAERVPSYGKRPGFASARAFWESFDTLECASVQKRGESDGDKYFILECRKI